MPVVFSSLDFGPEGNFGRLSKTCAEQMARRRDFKTGGVAIAQRHIAEITEGRCLFSVNTPNKFNNFGGTQVRLGGTSIQFLKWVSDAQCQTSILRPPDHHIVLHFPLTGEFEARQGSRRVDAKVGQLLNVIVPRQGLARMMAVDFGFDVIRPPKFEPLAVVDLNKAATLTRLIETIVADLNDKVSFFSDPVVAAQAERTLLFLILKSIPHDDLHVLNGPRSGIAPYYVRRAESHMRQHLSEDVTIESLTAAAGVSARTLYYGFKKYRKETPMKYLKGVRLKSARQALLDARAVGGRVSHIAARFGYRNFSQFSRDYKECFGENPAATVRGSEPREP
jgi:AraC-like DNA-binding protein